MTKDAHFNHSENQLAKLHKKLLIVIELNSSICPYNTIACHAQN